MRPVCEHCGGLGMRKAPTHEPIRPIIGKPQPGEPKPVGLDMRECEFCQGTGRKFPRRPDRQ